MATPAGWPYPQSELYAKLNFNQDLKRYGQVVLGGDQWPCSENADDELLVIGNDWSGFDPNSTIKPEWMVARLTGTPLNNLVGEDILPFKLSQSAANNSKSQGILAFNDDHILVYWAYLHQDVDPMTKIDQTHVALSTDNGATVTFKSALSEYIVRYAGAENLMVWGVLQLDPNYQPGTSGIDNDYIYVFLTNNRQRGTDAWNAAPPTGHQGKTQWMARVKWKGTSGVVANIYDRTKYQMFTGLSAGVPTWGTPGDFVTGKVPVFVDNNGMGVSFNIQWHSSINKFVATYIHCDNDAQNIPHQGIAVAIADSPFDQTAWEMIGYGQDLDKATAAETDAYMSVMAPSRWNDGARMYFATSTFIVGGSSTVDDTLIVSSAVLSTVTIPDADQASTLDYWSAGGSLNNVAGTFAQKTPLFSRHIPTTVTITRVGNTLKILLESQGTSSEFEWVSTQVGNIPSGYLGFRIDRGLWVIENFERLS